MKRSIPDGVGWIARSSSVRPLGLLVVACLLALHARATADEGQSELTEAHRQALLSVKRQGSAINSCRLSGVHFQYTAFEDGRPGEEPKGGLSITSDELFAAVREDRARAGADPLLDSLQRLLTERGARVDVCSGFRTYLIADGVKTRWDWLDGDRIAVRVAYDGSLWVRDSDTYNNQTTVRSTGTFVTHTLDTYRLIPKALADFPDGLRAARDLPFALAFRRAGASVEYGFGDGGLPEYMAVRRDNGRVVAQTFQFYFREEWKPVALPSVRIDCEYDADGKLGMINLYRILDATVNRGVPPDSFRIPLKAGRLYVDERKKPAFPVEVPRDYLDALEFAGRREADRARDALIDLNEVEYVQAGGQNQDSGSATVRAWYLGLLTACVFLAVGLWACLVWVRRYRRPSAGNS